MSETEGAIGRGTVLEAIPEEVVQERLQIKHILCPVDFSEFSDRAFRYAASLAWHFQSQLFLQHTVQIPTGVLLGGAEPTAIQEAWWSELQAAEERMRHLARTAGRNGGQIIPILNEGDPRAQILESVKEREVDLLVMGTHGHKGFNRLVLGSVTEQMIHEAACPVLVVSRPVRGFVTPESPEPIPLKTILLATDFSNSSDRAVTYALRWASEWGGKVVLFHAVEESPPELQGRVDLFPEYNPTFEKQIAQAWEKIRWLVPEAAQKRCEVAYEVRHGNPKEEILRVAEERDADLIVMGARGWGLTSRPWGSNSSAVVREGNFPVLVVRQLVV